MTRGIRAIVSEMWDATRWRMEEEVQGRKVFWYRGSDGVERARYRTQTSRLMEDIAKNRVRKEGDEDDEADAAHMLGLYAPSRPTASVESVQAV